MNKFLLKAMSLLPLAAFMSLPAQTMAFEPVAPGNLKADVNGVVVDLSWEWGNAGKCTLTEGFEGEAFPPENWEVKKHFSYDEDGFGNWMQYDFSKEEPELQLCHDGIKASVLMISVGDPDEPATSHQDEWLIVRPGVGAAYMDFWYFLHPELLEVGGYQDFPDHYYVQISYDNGESWEELWDGRWDMGNFEGPQQASLFLGQEADENTLVAFNAVSGEEESLYFLWVVDDVQFYTAEEAASRSLTVARSQRNGRISAQLAGKQLFRPFTPALASAKKVIPPDEWLNGGNYSYRVYLDGEILHSYLKARHYTDYSTKDPGTHTYKVVAWSESMDEETEAAVVDVDIEHFEFAAPRNLQVSYKEQDNGKYIVSGSWEAPEGEMTPVNYVVYINGKSVGWIDAGEELALGQSGLYKGAYTFEVEACYQYPEGTSARVSASVFPGTVPAPVSLSLSEEGGSVCLSWNSMDADGVKPDHFTVYRGDVLLADNVKDTEYKDAGAPEGSYFYSVHAVYPDGAVSLPASVAYAFGEVKPLSLPVSENFTNGHLPAGWNVELVDPYDRIKDMYSWRFDNWFGNELPDGSGLSDGFASVDGVAAGMNRLESYVSTPAVSLPSDEDAVLRFTKYFFEEKPGPSGPSSFIVAVSPAEEELFETIAELNATENGEVVLPLADYKGRDIVVRWGFLARNCGFAAIDNVRIERASSVSALPDAAGVFDIFTADGRVVGRQVSASFMQTLPAGIYILRAADGTTGKHMKKN